MDFLKKLSVIILVLNVLVSGKLSAQSPEGKWRNQDFEKGNYNTDLVYMFTQEKNPFRGYRLITTEETIIENADSWDQHIELNDGTYTLKDSDLCIFKNDKAQGVCYWIWWKSDDTFELQTKDGQVLKFARAYSKKDKFYAKFIKLRDKAGFRPPDFSKLGNN